MIYNYTYPDQCIFFLIKLLTVFFVNIKILLSFSDSAYLEREEERVTEHLQDWTDVDFCVADEVIKQGLETTRRNASVVLYGVVESIARYVGRNETTTFVIKD